MSTKGYQNGPELGLQSQNAWLFFLTSPRLSILICQRGIMVRVVVVINYANIWKAPGGVSGGYLGLKENILVIIIMAILVTSSSSSS